MTRTITSEVTAALRGHLGADFGGVMFGPEDDGYDSVRKVWNATVDTHPALLARCASAADVAAAIRAARDVGVPLSVRGGGHQVAGLSLCAGLVVDLGGMRGGVADPARRRARVGGGSLLGDVDRLTQRYGLMTPAGVISHTGLGGLTLGGGVGWTHRHFGLTCDNVVGADLVTADGRLLRVNEHEHPELLWALRGGGGNFGVVTTFELALHEVSQLLAGQAVFPLSSLERAVAHYTEFMADAPEELTAVLVLRGSPPPGMAVPEELAGGPIVMINAAWSGPLERGEPVVRRLLEGAGPAFSRVVVRDYLEQQTMQDDKNPHGLRNYLKSRYLTRVDDGAVEVLRAAARSQPGAFSQIELLRLGGAVGRLAEDATAFSGRNQPYILNAVATWTDPAEDPTYIAWARATYAALDPVGSDSGYLNFLGEEQDRAKAVFAGPSYDRLRRIKASVDPDNVFRSNISIPPAT